MAKKSISPDEKLSQIDFDLFAAIAAVDRKDYEWWDKLTEEQARKFVPYMMLQWCITVKGNKNVASYYVMAGNEYSNKHLFNEMIQNHPKLQWLMLCAGSPGLGKQYHQWIPHLSQRVGDLREKIKESTAKEYFGKVYSNTNQTIVSEFASEFTKTQNHQFRLAEIYPDMKRDDIEMLASIVTEEELDEYDRNCGE